MIKNVIISIIIVTITAFTIITLWNSSGPAPESYPALANAAVGVLGALLMIGRLALRKVFVFLWVVLQLAVVELNFWLIINLEFIGLEELTFGELNFVQYFAYFPDGAEITIGGNHFRINAVPAVYLLLFLIPMRSSQKQKAGQGMEKVRQQAVKPGEFFELKLFRLNKLMEHILPQRVEVVRKIDFTDSKNWLLVRLSKPVKFKSGRIVRNALIKPKEGRTFVKSQSGQLGYFRLLASEKNPDLANTKFIDWIFVR